MSIIFFIVGFLLGASSMHGFAKQMFNENVKLSDRIIDLKNEATEYKK